MKPVILLVGCPASGKTSVCQRVSDLFAYVPHDDYQERHYPRVLAGLASPAKSVLGEIPFGLSKIQLELEAGGLRVVPIFIYEQEPELRRRWALRGLTNASTIKGHLSRQETYRARAAELRAFLGSAEEVLKHLKTLT
jgi:hypothetical protein